MAKWCELHVDLLEQLESYIFLYADKIRIRAVCKWWYTNLSKLPNKKERKFPWLLKEIENNEEATHSLFNPFENKFYYIYSPEAQGKLVKGSSHGWVATVEDRYSTSPSDICLINPLTRALIKLPPRLKFPNVRFYRDYQYDKFVMLSNPSGNDCMIVAIYAFGYLAYCKRNDKKWKWKPLNFDESWPISCTFVDIIVYKGKLHAVNKYGELICFERIGFRSTKSKVKVVAKDSLEDSSPPYKPMKGSSDSETFNKSYFKYLVECSDGGLIMVARWIDLLCDETKEGEGIPYTRYFKVYKLDMDSRWVEVKNIGNDIVFLGLNSSFSVPSNQFPSCKGNQIYFADSSLSHSAKQNNQVDADIGVFNMEDGTIQSLKCFPGNFWPPTVWVNVNQ